LTLPARIGELESISPDVNRLRLSLNRFTGERRKASRSR